MYKLSSGRGCSISSRIAHKVNPIRTEALSVNNRFRTKYSEKSIGECFKVVLGYSVVGFGVTTMMWLMDDKSTISGWRLLAHLGPYQVPSLVASGGWKRALDRLDQVEELGLTESEIAQLLTDIEVITQRRQAVRRIVDEHGFSIFLPVFKNLSSNEEILGQSHFESNLRVAMDVVSATPARDRRVPLYVIEDLVSKNKNRWESKANEEVMRFREYRALLLLKLLQNEDNAKMCRGSEILNEFLVNEKEESFHVKYSALPFIPFLYTFKTEKLGYEYIDILERINTAAVGVTQTSQPPTQPRLSLKLDSKLDYQNFEKMVYLALCYSSLRYIPLISEYSLPVLKQAALGMAKSAIGASILDTIYRIEEHVIQSKPYFESSRDSKSALIVSGMIVGIHTCAGAVILRYLPFSFSPFLLMKFRDSFTDSFRFV